VATKFIGQIVESGLFDEIQSIRIVAALSGSSEQAARKAIKKYKFSVKQQTQKAT
jgi:hypothetical protein